MSEKTLKIRVLVNLILSLFLGILILFHFVIEHKYKMESENIWIQYVGVGGILFMCVITIFILSIVIKFINLKEGYLYSVFLFLFYLFPVSYILKFMLLIYKNIEVKKLDMFEANFLNFRVIIKKIWDRDELAEIYDKQLFQYKEQLNKDGQDVFNLLKFSNHDKESILNESFSVETLCNNLHQLVEKKINIINISSSDKNLGFFDSFFTFISDYKMAFICVGIGLIGSYFGIYFFSEYFSKSVGTTMGLNTNVVLAQDNTYSRLAENYENLLKLIGELNINISQLFGEIADLKMGLLKISDTLLEVGEKNGSATAFTIKALRTQTTLTKGMFSYILKTLEDILNKLSSGGGSNTGQSEAFVNNIKFLKDWPE